jgi:hypothetical protein
MTIQQKRCLTPFRSPQQKRCLTPFRSPEGYFMQVQKIFQKIKIFLLTLCMGGG